MKIWLDDERDEPSEWKRFKTSPELIGFLKLISYGEISKTVTNISLDHDLGLCSKCVNLNECIHNGTGYDVLKWIELETFTNKEYTPPILALHTSNSSARQKMQLAIESIQRIYKSRFLDE
jgi:hypothetical protein